MNDYKSRNALLHFGEHLENAPGDVKREVRGTSCLNSKKKKKQEDVLRTSQIFFPVLYYCGGRG